MNEEENALLNQLINDILPRFTNNVHFKARYDGWDDSTRLLFLRLAKHAHDRLGLDCWSVIRGYPIRFGRKELGQNRGQVAIGIDPCNHNFAVKLSTHGWRNLIEPKLLDRRITYDNLMTKITEIQNTNIIKPKDNNRKPYWPDRYNQDQGNPQPNGVAMSASTRNIIYYGPPGTGKTYIAFLFHL